MSDFRFRRAGRSIWPALALGALGCLVAPAALALQITTDWHEEQYEDPQGQLATPVIAAAVRNNDHIYELHLICGRDQYNGATPEARREGPVLELAVSTFTDDEQPAAIDTQAVEGQPGQGIDIGLQVGNMSRVTRTFRAEQAPNVISAAFSADATLGNDSDGPKAGAQFASAAGDAQGITIYKALGHESVSLPFSRDNEQVARFLGGCPVTAGS